MEPYFKDKMNCTVCGIETVKKPGKKYCIKCRKEVDKKHNNIYVAKRKLSLLSNNSTNGKGIANRITEEVAGYLKEDSIK